MNTGSYYGARSRGTGAVGGGDDFYSRPFGSANRGRPPLLMMRGGSGAGYRDRNTFQNMDRMSGAPPLKRGFGDGYYQSSNVGHRPSIMPAPPQFSGYRDDYNGYDDYIRYERRSWYDGPDYNSDYGPRNYTEVRNFGGPSRNFNGLDQNMKQRRIDREESVYGYLGIYNMKKGKSGIFIINYINFLLRSRLMYNGSPVVFSARLNESNLEAVFPSMEVLRAVVEKLSPIMVKGDITVYVSYKPPIPHFSPRLPNQPLQQQRRTTRPYPSRRPVAQVAPSIRKTPVPKARQPRKNKLKPPRLRGVFPDGVQPKKVVLVVDDHFPFISIADLNKNDHTVITGSRLDTAGFLEVIHTDENIDNDGVLYVIIPSFVFFLKQLDAFAIEDESKQDATINTAVASAAVTTPKISTGNTATATDNNKKRPLVDSVDDFASQIRGLDREFLTKPVSCAGKQSPDDTSRLSRLLTQHLVHAALQLRASVRANSDNCEVVFCGYPTHYMDTSKAEAALAGKMSVGRAQQVCRALVSAVHAFNDLCVNSWMLGGFKISNFGDPNLPGSFTAVTKANKTANDSGDTGSEELTTIKTKLNVVEETNGNNGVMDGEEDYPDECGVFSLSSLARLDWLSNSSDKVAIREGYTANVLTAVQRVCNFHIHKGGFVPWGPVEAEKFDEKNVPDIVKESIENKIYTERFVKEQGNTVYDCSECKLSVGDIYDADAHCYTRKHFNNVRRFVQQKAKLGGPKKSVLIGKAIASKAIPLSKDYLSKMINFKLVSVHDTPAGPRYQCLVCDISRSTNFDDTGLRFHVQHYRHRLSVNTIFGLPSHRALVCQHEHWSLVQGLLRHPPFDVVLLADQRHRRTLHRIAATSHRIHLLSFPDLVQDSNSASSAAVSQGLQVTQGRPALWILVAGVELLHCATHTDTDQETLDKLLEPVLSLHVFLRVHLSLMNYVVTAPLLPLHLLSDSLPHTTTTKLLAATNAVTVPQQQISAFAKLYKALCGRANDLHRATAVHANVHPVHGSLNNQSPVTTVLDTNTVPCLVPTPWHVEMQGLTTTAVYGMPSVFLRPYKLDQPNVQDLELDARILHVVVVGDIKCKKGARFESTKEFTIERELTFDAQDIDFIVSKAEPCEEGNFVAWYLSCPFPGIVFDSAKSDCCLAQNCGKPLMCWGYRGVDSVREALLKIWRFLCVLQSKMPAGNFVTLLPVFPSTIVTYDRADALTHSAMHALYQDYPNVFFSQDPQHMLMPAVEAFTYGWLDLFTKTGLHYSMRYDDKLFAQLDVREINVALTTLKEDHSKRVTNWLHVLNGLLKNYASRLSAELSDDIIERLGIKDKAVVVAPGTVIPTDTKTATATATTDQTLQTVATVNDEETSELMNADVSAYEFADT